MANTKISELTLAASGVGSNEFGINESGTSKKINLFQVANFTNLSGIKISLTPSNEISNATTAMVRVSGMDVIGVGAGTYVFDYYIRCQHAATTQSAKFAVNHTGTATSFMYSFFYPCQVATASTGVADQEINSTGGQIWSHQTTRIKNTTLGPGTDVDTVNADIMYRISGIMIVTVAGTLELYIGGETNTVNVTAKAGTSLLLRKVG